MATPPTEGEIRVGPGHQVTAADIYVRKPNPPARSSNAFGKATLKSIVRVCVCVRGFFFFGKSFGPYCLRKIGFIGIAKIGSFCTFG